MTNPKASAQLRVWAVDVSGWNPDAAAFDQLVERLLANVDVDAAAKVRRYYRPIDRIRSLAGKLLPRLMYIRHHAAQCTWSNLRFSASKEGRPYLAGPELAHPVDYNISHDGDWVVIAFHLPPLGAVTRTAGSRDDNLSSSIAASDSSPASSIAPTAASQAELRVGIDVMQISLPRSDPNVEGFCEVMKMSMTSAEEQWVRSASTSSNSSSSQSTGATRDKISLSPSDREMLARLFDLWTHKEAFTKNVGKGLGFDFKLVELAFWRLASQRLRLTDAEIAQTLPPQGSDASSSVGPASCVSDSPVLRIHGQPEPRYVFTEIALSAGRAAAPTEAGSQLVVAEGPFHSAQPRPQIGSVRRAKDAQGEGLLTIWTMEELLWLAFEVQEGRSLDTLKSGRV